LVSERASAGQNGRNGRLRHPNSLRQLHLAEPVGPHEFTKYILYARREREMLGAPDSRHCTSEVQ
jgi:hypothetical protein